MKWLTRLVMALSVISMFAWSAFNMKWWSPFAGSADLRIVVLVMFHIVVCIPGLMTYRLGSWHEG